MQDTDPLYSPHSLLPAPEPRTVSPPIDQFYHTVAKHLIRDTVRLMSNGLHIDLDKVEELESTLEAQLSSVHQNLAANPYIQSFLEHQFKQQISTFVSEKQAKLKPASFFLKPFKASDQVHRSYFMHIFSQQHGFSQPSDLLPSGVPKWPANLVKKLTPSYPVLTRLLDGTISLEHPVVIEATQLLAQHKADMYNSKYLAVIKDPITACSTNYPSFNPASSLQLRQFFDMYGIESENFSKKTDQPTFNRDELERIQKESSDEHILDVVTQLLEFSNAAIIQNNFIQAFYKYTINSRLYGSLKLFGAKSFRLTSSKPNLLNMPSTGSIFAKPIKQCFTAPPGTIILAVDYGALENRVIANLSKDQNLSNIYLQGLDGHCMNSLYYFKEEIAQHITLTGDPVVDARTYYEAVESGNKALKAIRQKGKAPSFGMQYGAYPPKIASSIKCTLEEAEQIFNRYHNELYPGVTQFREEFVAPTALATKKIHMGLGCYLHTDDPKRDIRTLTNGCSQFWSILTLLTINKMHHLIDEAMLSSDILCVSSIYDSIYYQVTAEPSVVKWLNDTLIEVMITPWVENQTVPNEAAAEIGLSWADLHPLPHNASLSEIESIMEPLLCPPPPSP